MAVIGIGRYLTWKIDLPVPEEGVRSEIFRIRDLNCYLKVADETGFHRLRLCPKKPFCLFTRFFVCRNLRITCFATHSKQRSAFAIQDNTYNSSNNNIFWEIPNADIVESSGWITFVVIFYYEDVCNTLSLIIELDKEDKLDESEHRTEDFCLESLSADLSELLEQGVETDIELVCGDQTIQAHRNILSCRSEVFSKMLDSGMSETQTGRVEIPDIDSGIFKDFVRYLYTAKLPQLTIDTAKGLYEIADKYAMVCLAGRCANFLLKNVCPKDACKMLVLADAHNDSDFKESLVNYILRKEIPLMKDIWLPFIENHAKLATTVLYRFYMSQKNKEQNTE